MKTTRRTFLTGCGTFGLSALSGCRSLNGASGSYSISLLGDTHFDTAPQTVYHKGWKPSSVADARDRQREFARNAEIWSDRLPRLVAAAAAVRRPDAKYLFQMGDLIQGDCAGMPEYLRFLADARRACTKGFGGLPFLTVCGNHDIRNGGAPAYDEFFREVVRESLGQTVESCNVLFFEGPDAFLFVDFMRPDAARLERMLKDSEGARHTFIVVHSAIAPTDTWGTYWFLFGKPEDTERRRWLFRALLRRRAIVLSGHLHNTQIRRWRRPEGELVEFVMNSVWRPAEDKVSTVFSTPAQYGSFVRTHPAPMDEEHDGCHQHRTVPELLALVDEYRPGLVDYRMYRSAGHYQLRVTEKSVDMDFFACDARMPYQTFNLF